MRDSDNLADLFQNYLDTIPPQLNYILPEDLAAALAKDSDSYFILDNRTPAAYQAAHIPGAVNIWMKDVLRPEQRARLPRDRTIVICCWVGHTASQLLPILATLGYDVVGLKYGMGTPKSSTECKLGWAELDLPTESG